MKKSVPKVPEPPKGLSRESKNLWRDILADYDLDAAGLKILETGCEALDDMRDSQRLIREEGRVVKDRFNQVREHPAVAMVLHSRAAMQKSLKLLGIDLEPLNDGPGRPLNRM